MLRKFLAHSKHSINVGYYYLKKIHWRRDRLPTPVFLGFPCGSAGKESAFNAGDLDSTLGLGRSPGEGKGYPLQYSGLENSMDYIVHGIVKSWTQLSYFHFRLVTAFLPRSKHLLISWLQSPSAVVLEPKKIKSVTVCIVSPSICHDMMGPDAMVLVF